MALTSDQRTLLDELPRGQNLGNGRLLQRLDWDRERYIRVRSELIKQGLVALGRGRGGSVRRIDFLGGPAEHLMAIVPADGSPIGNQHIRDVLKWDEDTYWKTRNDLLERGLIGRGRGRGGSIFRVVPDAPLEDIVNGDDEIEIEIEIEDSGWYEPRTAVELTRPSAGPQTYAHERDMYPDLRSGLHAWARDHQLQAGLYCIGETVDQCPQTGIWSRPDMVVIGIKHFPLINRRVLEAITFEARLSTAVDIRGIYEASAHCRFSTHSYAFFQVTHEQYKDAKLRDAMQLEAIRVGVGLIFATVVDDFNTWDELAKARAQQPEWEMLEDFVREQLGGKDVVDALWNQIGRDMP